MTDNFNLIKPLLEFENENTFYFIQIMKRRKENPDMKKGVAIIDNYFIYNLEDLDKLREKIVNRCELHNARAYINLNQLDLEKIGLHTAKKIMSLIIEKQFRSIKNAYVTSCGNYHSQDIKRWVIDLDKEDLVRHPNLLETVSNLINSLHEDISSKDYKIVAEIPTKSGIHIISNPFNMKKFQDLMSPVKILIHKNSPTILYTT